ncbi:ethanolamine utilization protein EutN, partial [Listeria monocytogenes]|nr:ethanolamine utilization protein EutN [Listeria monocytogenes]
MQIGKVTGSLWATRKDEKLNGLKLLIVEICTDETE